MPFSRIIDLSHPLKKDMPLWPGDPPVRIKRFAVFNKDGFYMQEFGMGEHTGTHIGTPAHFYPQGYTIDRIPVKNLIQPAVKIDVSRFVDSDTLVEPQYVREWQAVHGDIVGGIVLFQTGWSKFWGDQAVYWGGVDDDKHFPGIAPECIKLLVDLGVSGVGIDTGGIDGGRSRIFASNKLLAQHNKFHLENLTQLNMVPERGATLFIGALSLQNGSGSPCRVLAAF
ncbi:cyclase family protein [candidate division KSB1 bacterium]|nr:cyclase family protein [candidate division KSB1 bacterium]